MKSITIDGKEFDISEYSDLEDLVDTEFEGEDLSKIEVEDFEDIPDRLYNKTPVPCTLEEALEDTVSFDTIFDWVDYVQDNDEDATLAYIDNQWSWYRDHFEETYEGYYESEEDFAEEYLDEIGWEIDLSSYFDYSGYGESCSQGCTWVRPNGLIQDPAFDYQIVGHTQTEHISHFLFETPSKEPIVVENENGKFVFVDTGDNFNYYSMES